MISRLLIIFIAHHPNKYSFIFLCETELVMVNNSNNGVINNNSNFNLAFYFSSGPVKNINSWGHFIIFLAITAISVNDKVNLSTCKTFFIVGQRYPLRCDVLQMCLGDSIDSAAADKTGFPQTGFTAPCFYEQSICGTYILR